MSELDQLSINALRFLAVDAVEKAKSGHPGAPLGDSPIVYLLFHKYMRHNPANSKWTNRDRFVLSNGHASAHAVRRAAPDRLQGHASRICSSSASMARSRPGIRSMATPTAWK